MTVSRAELSVSFLPRFHMRRSETHGVYGEWCWSLTYGNRLLTNRHLIPWKTLSYNGTTVGVRIFRYAAGRLSKGFEFRMGTET